MSSILGVSVGAGAIRLARPPAGDGSATDPESFEQRTFVVPPETPSAERAALSVAAALNSTPSIIATVLACRGEQQARALRVAMAEQGLHDYTLVPDIEAILEFAVTSGALQGVNTLAVYDLGASGLSVTVVDTASREVRHTERTGDISGEYFDSLVREQQINSGRIAHPPDPADLMRLDALCRAAKERLSASNAVALPSDFGPVLLTQENFTALIARAVETSVRSTRDVIARSGVQVQALLAVGGGVRIPLVSRTLRDILEIPVLVPPEPEAATARGAALLARKVPGSRATIAAAPEAGNSETTRDPLRDPTGPRPESATPAAGVVTPAPFAPATPRVVTPHPGAALAYSGSHEPAAATATLQSTGPQAAVAAKPDPYPAMSGLFAPVPQPGIFGPPAGDPAPAGPRPLLAPASSPEPTSDRGTRAPESATAALPETATPQRLSPAEDPPTVALRIPAKLLPRRSFDVPPRRGRELSAAAVAVSALVVVAAIGIGLGYGQHMFRQESTTVESTTQAPTTPPSTRTAAPALPTTTAPEHASMAEPPPVAAPRETEAPTTTSGPNTFQVPGLPPIVVPTIPPDALPFPRPPR
ncbi:Hsp70 family protein [Nocardia sp. NPDC024068]|uniref:Hsp70 family protein n=1 Tax=Nocardia sp. NPDC024068 TaxID=3157197 RepID=UPI0033F20DA6